MKKPKWYNWTGDPMWDEYCKVGSVIIVFCLLILGLFLGLMVSADAQPEIRSCPEGSYNIGITKDDQPICKLEPTGCPYGDSIPLDMCDKFKPLADPNPQAEVLSETITEPFSSSNENGFVGGGK